MEDMNGHEPTQHDVAPTLQATKPREFIPIVGNAVERRAPSANFVRLERVGWNLVT